MKFSDLLGEPEPESRTEVPTPPADDEPISVFAPDPTLPAVPPVPIPSGPVVSANPPASPVSRWADNVVDPATRRAAASPS